MLFYLLLHSFLLVSALPLVPRQAPAQPSSVTTVQTIDSATGPVTQTCVIVLTPITDGQGQAAVQEVKTCTIAMAIPNPDGSDTNSPALPSPSTSSPPVPVPTSSPIATVVTSTSTFVPTSASSVLTSVTPSSTPVAVNGASSVPAPAAPTSIADSQSTSSVVVPVSTTSSSISGSTVAQHASATTADFVLPGRRLSVLPIGLGIFGGISVIALIVVGLVTYERTKYRRAFRQRKLAQFGGGGMV